MSAAAFQTQLESDQFTHLGTLNKKTKKYPFGGCGGFCEKNELQNDLNRKKIGLCSLQDLRVIKFDTGL